MHQLDASDKMKVRSMKLPLVRCFGGESCSNYFHY